MVVQHFPFRPALQGFFATRFYEQIAGLLGAENSSAERDRVVAGEIHWATHECATNPDQRRIYRAT